MNVGHSKFPILRLAWTRAICLAVAIVAVQLTIPPKVVDADIFNGVESSVTEGTTTSFSPFVFSPTNFASDGGLGSTSAELNIYDSITDGTLYGSVGTQVDSPLLRSISQPAGADDASNAFTGAMVAYQYNGTTSALISFDWSLTGTLTQPFETGALIRGKAGFVTDASAFSPNINDFFEGGGTIEDNFSYLQTGAGIVDENGTLSFTASPGQVFNIVMSLQTYGGRNGAISDAFSTFQGNLTSSTGSISAVPEPASAGLLAVFGGLYLLRRRKR